MKVFSAFIQDIHNKDWLKYHITPFLYELDKFEFVDDIQQADIVCSLSGSSFDNCLHLLNSDQVLLVLGLFHMDDAAQDTIYIDHYIQSLLDKNITTKKIIFAHTNLLNKDPKYCYFDMMMYRHKLYYQNYVDDLSKTVWSLHSNKDMYQLNNIDTDMTKNKNILFAGRIYNHTQVGRMNYRKQLRNHLLEYNNGKGFINDCANGAYFFPNNINEAVVDYITNISGSMWYPLNDSYYKNSMVSVYVETLINYGNISKIVTEKTFDPLIKGHFILPFGTVNFIKTCKEVYGFEFPNWIDYSYDGIEDADVRFKHYIKSVDQIINMPIETLQNYVRTNRDILYHNRNVILNYKMPSFYNSIINCINFQNF